MAHPLAHTQAILPYSPTRLVWHASTDPRFACAQAPRCLLAPPQISSLFSFFFLFISNYRISGQWRVLTQATPFAHPAAHATHRPRRRPKRRPPRPRPDRRRPELLATPTAAAPTRPNDRSRPRLAVPGFQLASQITTVTRPRRCSSFSIRSKMWPSTYVSSNPSPQVLFFLSWMTGRIIMSTSRSTCSSARPIPSIPSHHRSSIGETIQLSGHMRNEKLHIARWFRLPKQLAQNGLSEAHVQLAEPAAARSSKPSRTTSIMREAGVRSLERSVSGIVRFKECCV